MKNKFLKIIILMILVVTPFLFNGHLVNAQTLTVTPTAGTGGSISPNTPQAVSSGSTKSFTVTPNTGYYLSSVTGCSGGLISANTYMTGAISNNCTVVATFIPNTSLSGYIYSSPSILCEIPAGGDSCDTIISWNTRNPGVNTSRVTSSYPSANTVIANANAGSQTVTSRIGARSFFLQNPSGSNIANVTVTPYCASGTSWDGSICQIIPPMSGTLTPSSSVCTIALGESTCTKTLTWTTTNPVGVSAVTNADGATPNSGPSLNNGSQTFTIQYNNGANTTFYLHNNAQELATAIVVPGCVSGSAWDIGTNKCITSSEGITRAQAAVELKNRFQVPSTSCSNPFTDISGNTQTEQNAIKDLWQAGITLGCGAGIYCPNDNLIRADATVFVDRGTSFWNGTSLDFWSTVFSDLPLSSSTDKSFFYMINAAYRKMSYLGTQISTPPTFDPLSFVNKNTFLSWVDTAASGNSSAFINISPNSNKLLTFQANSVKEIPPSMTDFNMWGMTPTHCTDGSTLCNTGLNLVNRIDVRVNCYDWLPGNISTLSEPPNAGNTWNFGYSGNFYGLLNPPGENNVVFVRMFGRDVNNYGGGYPVIATIWDQFPTPIPTPNLVSYASEQIPATVNIPTVFSSTIANWGTGGTGASFSNFFQVTDSTHDINNPIDLPSTSMTALAAGANNTATKSYTFTSVGTYSVRACADLPPQPNGVITESNEGDNCGSWKTVVVSDVPVVPAPDLTASTPSPSSATVNLSVSLSSMIINTGTDSTGASFSNFFQVTDSTHDINNPIDLPSTSMTALAAGANNTATKSYTFTSVGTYSVRACADKTSSGNTGVITESNEINNCSAWIDVVVTLTPRPDLTALIPSPTSAIVDVPVIFSSNIFNAGNAGTGSSFSNFFQIATDPNDEGTISNSDSTSMTALAAGANNTATKSYTFTSVGTYSVRACADLPPQPNGVIVESNEGNNCSGWTNVTVSPANSCVANQGNDCISAPNGCGQINSGSIQCNGSCSAATPPTPSPCPVCANGATNPPECTYDGDLCLNGADNPPECTTIDEGKTCINGASNPPVCKIKKPIFKEN